MMLEELKKNLEALYDGLIKKHEMDYQGEPMVGEIYQIQQAEGEPVGHIDVVFNDENMGYLIAGYVPGSVHDEMEDKLAELGYSIVDCDGCRMTLEPNKKPEEPSYPNCDKLFALGDRTQGIHEFVEFLNQQGIRLAKFHKYDDCEEEQLTVMHKCTNELINECYGIDSKELERERQALLASLTA